MEYERGFDRLVNFSDAVVAIAATLLILPLVELAEPDEGAQFIDILRNHGVELFAFVLSFLVIFSQWLSHHRVFRDLVGYTRGLIWVNFVWLLSIVFLPFPTKLIAEKNGYDASASSLYVANIAVSVIAMFVADIIVSRHPNIVASDTPTAANNGAVTSVLILVALGLSFTPLGLWSLLVLLLTRPINRVIGRVAE
ncbi:TMEM175 family protein [Rhodococcoides yunnanense]|uniref:TMEM175 family protein n=1 Tax=Rhodococcoides yunnanense TaxID=278209 RepID=A0ABU4BFR1_9NOCA|nr:TMEM175 family protein [Rhodococcus yunnanensis]MDV6263037.1 TMEM175 family protein [Rhodococcus yunnanensis]